MSDEKQKKQPRETLSIKLEKDLSAKVRAVGKAFGWPQGRVLEELGKRINFERELKNLAVELESRPQASPVAQIFGSPPPATSPSEE